MTDTPPKASSGGWKSKKRVKKSLHFGKRANLLKYGKMGIKGYKKSKKE